MLLFYYFLYFTCSLIEALLPLCCSVGGYDVYSIFSKISAYFWKGCSR